MKQFNLCIIIFVLLMSSLAQGSQGHVDVLVSKDGMPLENFSIKIDGKALKTDEIGFATTKVKTGIPHKLSFVENEKSKEISFDVVENERTQLLVNILGDSMLHDLIEPEKVSKKAFEEGVQETGTLNLVVKSINGSPVSNARIFVKGTGITERTNSKGMAQIKVPVGELTISLSHQKFSTQIERKIKVEKNQSATKNVALTPTGLVLEDFVVLAPSMKGSIEALIEVRRKSSNLADVMSAEQMAKTGDSDAAGSLRRVTGLTLKDGKFVYVRGLGERYSATLLNGVALPSPDPSRRVIPLDLFPVQFLDSMVIQKSYSPDMPGEFGGGTVMLKTKSIPDKFFLKTSFSQTHNSNVSTVNSYQSSPTDW
ncbi:MAG: TonB-dependent receptor plug domain-containing protein, partial [Bdellovibrionales bacterium]|nr:TonB-dependent receptor plug domain-containing protein [Bdellovibrionales bacterium]